MFYIRDMQIIYFVRLFLLVLRYNQNNTLKKYKQNHLSF